MQSAFLSWQKSVLDISSRLKYDSLHPTVADIQILEAIGIDYIDESEVLTPADEVHHITKHNFKVPFVCGCRNLGEALRRIAVPHLLQTISNVSGRSSIDTYKGRSRNR